MSLTYRFRMCAAIMILAATCAAMPALEGGNRVVALVIEDLLPDLQTQLTQWQSDLNAEGYEAVIRTWPRDKTETRDDNLYSRQLWERIKAIDTEADLHGVIFVGTFPRIRYKAANDKYYGRCDETYMHLDSFQTKIDTLDPDHWLSHVMGVDAKERPLKWGHEAEVINRYFAKLHAWRTGALRLPHQVVTAITSEFDTDTYGPSDLHLPAPRPTSEVWGLYMTQIWPDAYHHVGKKGSNALALGGGYFYESSHGMNPESNQIMGMSFFVDQPAQFHFLGLSSCYMGTLGGMASQSLGAKYSAVLYANTNDIAWDKTLRDAWANGETLGRAILERRTSWIRNKYSFGDLTVRPMANPANQLPVCDSFTVDKQVIDLGESVSFVIDGSDPDDALSAVECYPKGWFKGKAPGIVGTPGSPIVTSYDRPHVYQAFALVQDSYRAYGWRQLEVVVKPDVTQPLRVNCGFWPTTEETADRRIPDDADYLNSTGELWLHDQWHSTGTYGRSGDNRNSVTTKDIAGTDDDDIYRSAVKLRKNKPVSYRFPFPAGDYAVTILAADFESDSAGNRLFDVSIDGTMVATDLDVWDLSGGQRQAWQQTWAINHATDDDLVVTLKRSAEATKDPYVSAIAIVPMLDDHQRMVRITVIDAGSAVKECTVICEGISVDIDENQPEAIFELEDPDDDALIEFMPIPTVIAWSLP